MVSLVFGLKEVNIAMNIVKFGEHSYLPNGHQILIPRNWSKVKLHHAVSLWLGLNGVKIAQNITKVGLHACLSNGHPNL